MGKILVIGGGNHETTCTAYDVRTESTQRLPVNDLQVLFKILTDALCIWV